MTYGARDLGSTSGKTSAGSFPPSSRVRLIRLEAAFCMMDFPAAMEPVKDMREIPGWADTQGPLNHDETFSLFSQRARFNAAYSSSSPERTDSTPGGRTCCASSINFKAQRGAKGDGLTITQFPATKAGASFQTINDNGKLKVEGLDGLHRP